MIAYLLLCDFVFINPKRICFKRYLTLIQPAACFAFFYMVIGINRKLCSVLCVSLKFAVAIELYFLVTILTIIK